MTTLLTALRWLVRLVLFFFLFGLALKNSDTIVLHFFFDWTWSAPVAVALLVTFVVGVLVGLMAAFGNSWRRRKHRRDQPSEVTADRGN
jgi:uncharacterized integral membrane protein